MSRGRAAQEAQFPALRVPRSLEELYAPSAPLWMRSARLTQ